MLYGLASDLDFERHLFRGLRHEKETDGLARGFECSRLVGGLAYRRGSHVHLAGGLRRAGGLHRFELLLRIGAVRSVVDRQLVHSVLERQIHLRVGALGDLHSRSQQQVLVRGGREVEGEFGAFGRLGCRIAAGEGGFGRTRRQA